jgi:hypothetical protein
MKSLISQIKKLLKREKEVSQQQLQVARKP